MTSTESISAEFPFASRYVEVLGSRMHYVESGQGDPVLFLHGNPTSCYLWRNVIPHLSSQARCIAPDLIGMGKSDKPDLSYTFQDHALFLEAFIDALDLDGITLVIHDWGSALGFDYARRHPGRIRGIAFMEALVRPMRWRQFPRDFRLGFRLMRAPLIGRLLVQGMNIFVEKILPAAVVRPLSEAEMAHYRAPYPDFGSRKPLWRWPGEIPIEGRPERTYAVVQAYGEWLQQSELPKLLLFAHPGGLIDAEMVAWCRKRLPNLDTVDIGEGIHFIQEDHPHGIGEALGEWYGRIQA